MNTDIKGVPAPRRRRATRRDRVSAGPRAVCGGAHRCTTGRDMTAMVTGRQGTSAVVAISGEIDVRTAGRLRAVVTALADEGRDQVVADFGAVTFCDAAGLGALVAAANRLRERGGTLCLAGVRPAQRRILRITRLDRVFPLYDTPGEALSG